MEIVTKCLVVFAMSNSYTSCSHNKGVTVVTAVSEEPMKGQAKKLSLQATPQAQLMLRG